MNGRRDDLARVFDAERVEKNRVEHASDGRICSDTNRDTRDHCSNGPRLPARKSPGKTKISQQCIQQLQPPDLAAFFEQSGSVSKLATRLISRLCGTITGTDEFVGELLEVGTKLFREGSAPFSPSPKRA